MNKTPGLLIDLIDSDVRSLSSLQIAGIVKKSHKEVCKKTQSVLKKIEKNGEYEKFGSECGYNEYYELPLKDALIVILVIRPKVLASLLDCIMKVDGDSLKSIFWDVNIRG